MYSTINFRQGMFPHAIGDRSSQFYILPLPRGSSPYQFSSLFFRPLPLHDKKDRQAVDAGWSFAVFSHQQILSNNP